MSLITLTNKKGDSELSVALPDNWELVAREGGSIVLSSDEGQTNALQISTMIFEEEKGEKLTKKELIEKAKKIGEKSKSGEPDRVESDTGLTGDYGTAIYEKTTDNKYLQIWYISDGKILTFATFMCEPDTEDRIKEQAGEIAKRIKIKREIQ